MDFEAYCDLMAVYCSNFITNYSTVLKTIAEFVNQPALILLFLNLCIKLEIGPSLSDLLSAW